MDQSSPAPNSQEQIQEAQETLETVFEISKLLNTGLDRESLSILISLVENGVNADALAAVVKELRKEVAKTKSTAGPAAGSSAQPKGWP